MKKFLSLAFVMILTSLFLISPTKANGADVYYDLGNNSKLYLKSEVCKIANCLTIGTGTDWYNYSTTSENVGGDSGAGQTLVVKPGDTVTFRDSTWFNRENDDDKISINQEQQLYANLKYGIKFTNGSFLTFGNKFSHALGYDDVDQNDNLFQYISDNNIPLSENLVSGDDPEVGAVTATINTDTPDGTIITGTFYLAGLSYQGGMAPAKALASEDDGFIRSVARIQVSNPAPEPEPDPEPEKQKEVLGASVAPTPTPTIPATGGDSKAEWLYVILPMILIVVLGSSYVFKYAKK